MTNTEPITNKTKWVRIGVVTLGVVIISAILAYMLSVKITVDKWQDKVYSGVQVNNVDLTGMTRDEVSEFFNEEIVGKLNEKKLNITVGDKIFNYTYADIGINGEIEKCIDEIMNYGKDKEMLEKYSLIKNKNNLTYDFSFGSSYSEELADALAENIKNEINVEAKNASMTISNGQPIITADVSGYEVSTDGFQDLLKESLENDLDSETNIEFQVKVTNAKVTKSDLSKITGIMSTFSTTYAVGDRGKNVELATSLVNGIILMPGETFSYDEVSQKGRGHYTFAGGYVNGKVEQVEAGGICQVSSTLYRAVMRANIRSVERHNHMMTVGYTPIGLDATVAWGYLDYKFKNTYDFPIYIQGIAGNGTVTFNIYGAQSALNGNTYDLVSENLGTDSQGYTRANSYLVTYKNGKEVNREFIAKDTYSPSNH